MDTSPFDHKRVYQFLRFRGVKQWCAADTVKEYLLTGLVLTVRHDRWGDETILPFLIQDHIRTMPQTNPWR